MLDETLGEYLTPHDIGKLHAVQTAVIGEGLPYQTFGRLNSMKLAEFAKRHSLDPFHVRLYARMVGLFLDLLRRRMDEEARARISKAVSRPLLTD